MRKLVFKFHLQLFEQLKYSILKAFKHITLNFFIINFNFIIKSLQINYCKSINFSLKFIR